MAEAARLLDGLHGEGLLTETVPRRYGMHDLLRRYARDLAGADPDDDRDQALGRLLDYYQHTAAIAQGRLARHTRPGPAPLALTVPPAAPVLADAGRALAWARAERDTLLACLDHVTSTGQHARVTALTAALTELLRRDGPWTEAITHHTAALQSARDLGDRLGQANAFHELGNVRRLTGDHPGATRDLEQALAIYRDRGSRLGEANALNDLGIVRRLTGDYPGFGAGPSRHLCAGPDTGGPSPAVIARRLHDTLYPPIRPLSKARSKRQTARILVTRIRKFGHLGVAWPVCAGPRLLILPTRPCGERWREGSAAGIRR